MSEPLVLVGVTRVYRGDGGDLPVLRGVDLTVRAGFWSRAVLDS